MRVLQRPGDTPNRTERQMVEELDGAPGWLVVNMVVTSSNRRQREVDGILLTPGGVITIEAKASPRQAGPLVCSVNDEWTIGGEVADLAGKSNPFLQARTASQQVSGVLADAGMKHLRVPGAVYVAGNARLEGGPCDLGAVVVATTGTLRDAVETKLAKSGLLNPSAYPAGVPVLSAEEALQVADLLGFPQQGRPSVEELLEEGFGPHAEKEALQAAAAQERAAKQAERAERAAERAAVERGEREERDRAHRERSAERYAEQAERRRAHEEEMKASRAAAEQREAEREEMVERFRAGIERQHANTGARQARTSPTSSGSFSKRTIPALLLAAYVLTVDLSQAEWATILGVAAAAAVLHVRLVVPRHNSAYRARVLLALPVHVLLGAIPVVYLDEGGGGVGTIILFSLAWLVAVLGTKGDERARVKR